MLLNGQPSCVHFHSNANSVRVLIWMNLMLQSHLIVQQRFCYDFFGNALDRIGFRQHEYETPSCNFALNQPLFSWFGRLL